jgi:hypothetical protein
VFESLKQRINEGKTSVNRLRQGLSEYMMVLRSTVNLIGADPDDPIAYTPNGSNLPDLSDELSSLEKLVGKFNNSYQEVERNLETLEKEKEEQINKYLEKDTSSKVKCKLELLTTQAELIKVDFEEIQLTTRGSDAFTNALVRAGYESIPKPSFLLEELGQKEYSSSSEYPDDNGPAYHG